MSKDALHIHLGLFVFLAAAFLLRRPLRSVWPWLSTLALELLNELLDVFHWHAGSFSFEITDNLKDVANTMFWPTVVFLFARFAAARAAGPTAKTEE